MWRILTQNRNNLNLYSTVIKVNQTIHTITFPLWKLQVTKWSLVHCTGAWVVGTQGDWTVSHILAIKKKKNWSPIAILYDLRKYLRYLNRCLLSLHFILYQNKRDGSGLKAGVTLTKKPEERKLPKQKKAGLLFLWWAKQMKSLKLTEEKWLCRYAL